MEATVKLVKRDQGLNEQSKPAHGGRKTAARLGREKETRWPTKEGRV